MAVAKGTESMPEPFATVVPARVARQRSSFLLIAGVTCVLLPVGWAVSAVNDHFRDPFRPVRYDPSQARSMFDHPQGLNTYLLQRTTTVDVRSQKRGYQAVLAVLALLLLASPAVLACLSMRGLRALTDGLGVLLAVL